MTNVNTAEVIEMTIEPVRVSVAREIRDLLDTVGTSYIKVGELLAEARADFDNQKDFLAWAEVEFNIKKAQCYNLMNVSRVFGEDKRFTGVPMRVMLALIPLADEAEVMEKAAALADAGALNTAAVNELLGKPAKPAVAPAANEETKTSNTEALVQAGYTEDQAVVIGAVTPAPAEQDAAAPVQAPATVGVQDATMQALLDQNKRLSAQLEEAMNRIAELSSTRESKKATAPMLPQFKSKCLYARLGLSAEQATSKSAISKARRELVKIGYGEGHSAWESICEAVEKLTASAE